MKDINIKMTCLFLLTLLAVYQDIKSYKIKNYTIIIGIITGLSINIVEVGFIDTYPFLIGMTLPIIILFPLFLIKALGAGDIKLYSVIGGFYGTYYLVRVLIISFIFAAILSLIYLIKTRSIHKRITYLITYIQKMKEMNKGILSNKKADLKTFKIIPYYQKEKGSMEGIIHFSIAIFFALIVIAIYK